MSRKNFTGSKGFGRIAGIKGFLEEV